MLLIYIVQASGFLAVYFIECSDFLILAIAIHTAVYVFQPTVSTPGHREEGGIWKWRYWVYLSIMCLSGLFTGLAFVKQKWDQHLFHLSRGKAKYYS